MQDPDKILEGELGEVGNRSGEPGADIGARWAARHMPNNAFAASIELDMPADQVLAELGEVAQRLGRVLEHEATNGASLRAVIGAGFWNMNPAVVDVQISGLGSQRCSVVITGTAKEGLIKQRAGEGAVRRFIAAARFGSPSAE